MAGWDRSVCRKDAMVADPFLSLFGRFFLSELLPQQFEGQKGRMTFIHVENCRFDTQRAKQPDGSHANNNLLPNACSHIAAVDPAGEFAIMVLVFSQFGVEQINYR